MGPINTKPLKPYTLSSHLKKPTRKPKLVKEYGCPVTRVDCGK